MTGRRLHRRSRSDLRFGGTAGREPVDMVVAPADPWTHGS